MTGLLIIYFMALYLLCYYNKTTQPRTPPPKQDKQKQKTIQQLQDRRDKLRRAQYIKIDLIKHYERENISKDKRIKLNAEIQMIDEEIDDIDKRIKQLNE